MKLKKSTIIFGPMTVIVMVIIFIFSAENSEISSDTSGRYVRLVIRFFIKNFDSLTAAEQTELFGRISHIIRKGAHFTIYTTLGVFSSLTAGKRRLFSRASLIVLGSCFFYACTDEIHQYFVPGRACMFTDVLLDTCGSLTGMCLSLLMIKVVQKKSRP